MEDVRCSEAGEAMQNPSHAPGRLGLCAAPLLLPAAQRPPRVLWEGPGEEDAAALRESSS